MKDKLISISEETEEKLRTIAFMHKKTVKKTIEEIVLDFVESRNIPDLMKGVVDEKA